MVTRELHNELISAASEYPVVTLLGLRQSGKTILAQMSFPRRDYRSLEDPDVRMAAQADPRGFLENLPDGAILDEIQRTPELLSYIQGRVDRHKRAGEFILTGSHQPALHAAISQSLAGENRCTHPPPLLAARAAPLPQDLGSVRTDRSRLLSPSPRGTTLSSPVLQWILADLRRTRRPHVDEPQGSDSLSAVSHASGWACRTGGELHFTRQ
jgi:hypothetical protein